MARVAVAMSGGVDSSVAALLCLEAGHEVFGVTMILRDADVAAQTAAGLMPAAVDNAQRVASKLSIRHQVVDLREQFEALVVQHFCAEYAGGRTPNPCVVCNPVIKFGLLMDWAVAAGAELFATGHYARIATVDTGRLTLRTAADLHKDQSYFLYRLSQQQLSRSIFPLGEMTKVEVRSIAEAAGLPSARTQDSQDLCFVSPAGYRALVKSHNPGAVQPGPVYDLTGRRVGTHHGIASYTVGQRRGIGVAAPGPQYVLAIDGLSNSLVIGPAAAAACEGFAVVDCHWLAVERLVDPLGVEVKLRHATRRLSATVSPGPVDSLATVRLAIPQIGVTPGQAAVFYLGELVLGGGTIMLPTGPITVK
jgi:tRNA-specific 2-thiouridylase